MDRTPVIYDFQTNKTIKQRGEKTVLVNTTGHKKSIFTVVLPYLTNESKLPALIFKRMILPKSVNFPNGLNVRAHLKGWMDEEGVKDWFETVWN